MRHWAPGVVCPTAPARAVCWLCSDDADDINGMRFIAAMWDGSLPREERIAKAGAPTAWAQIGSLAQRPSNWAETER